MDPITLALAGLNLAGAGYNFREQSMLNRAQNRLGRDQGNAEIRAANARAQFEDDLRRRRRMLAESLAARGLEDSTISGDEMNYLNRGATRQQQGADDRVNIARRGLNLFNRQARSRRRGNYINLGLGVANALGGAYASLPGASMASGIGAASTGAGTAGRALGNLF